MSARFERFGYDLCMRADWIGGLWARLWYRFYCPYPLRDDHSAAACIAAGDCSCDNNKWVKAGKPKVAA